MSEQLDPLIENRLEDLVNRALGKLMGSLDDPISKKLESLSSQQINQPGSSSWQNKPQNKRPSGDQPHKRTKKSKGIAEEIPDDAGDRLSVSDTADGHDGPVTLGHDGPVVLIDSDSDEEDQTYEPELDLSCSSEFDSDYENDSNTKRTSDEASLALGFKILDPFGDNMFDPLMIKHPCSPEWTPSQHVAKYITFWLRREIPKEVRARLRSECPRPSLPDMISKTPNSTLRWSPLLTRAEEIQGRA